MAKLSIKLISLVFLSNLISFCVVHFLASYLNWNLFIEIAIFAVLSLVLSSIVLAVNTRNLFNLFHQTGNTLKQLNEGNFTARFTIKSKEAYIKEIQFEFEKLENMLSRWIYELLLSSVSIKNSSLKIDRSTQLTSNGITELSQNIDQIRTYIEETAESFTDIASSTAELSSSSQTISKSSQEVVDYVNYSKEVAFAGGQSVTKVVESMKQIQVDVSAAYHVIERLCKVSDEISSISGSIAAISKQTNLLALNAAIEAAKSGEHGRGFAVVAAEIRKLAEESNTAALQISRLINSITSEARSAEEAMGHAIKDVEAGVDIVSVAGSNLEEIVSTIGKVVSVVQTISAGVHEQFLSTDTIAANTEEASGKGQTSNALIQELSVLMEKQVEQLDVNVNEVTAMQEVAGHLEATMEKFDKKLGAQMLEICGIVAQLMYGNKLNADVLQALLKDTGLSEFHITDTSGKIYLSTSPSLLGFQFIFEEGSQTNDFLPILKNSSLKVNQKTMFRDADGELYKYTALSAIGRSGIVQAGLKAANITAFKGSDAINILREKYMK